MCLQRFPLRAQVVKCVKWSGLSTGLLLHLLIYMKTIQVCVCLCARVHVKKNNNKIKYELDKGKTLLAFEFYKTNVLFCLFLL